LQKTNTNKHFVRNQRENQTPRMMIEECMLLRSEAFEKVKSILTRFKEIEQSSDNNDIYKNINLLLKNLDTIYEVTKTENNLRMKTDGINYSTLHKYNKNVGNVVLISLRNLQYIKSSVTILIHCVVAPLIIKGLHVPKYQNNNNNKSDANDNESNIESNSDQQVSLQQIKLDNKISLLNWSNKFIKICQTHLIENIYKKQNNKLQKQYLWKALNILWKLLLGYPSKLPSTSSNTAAIVFNQSVFYVSVIDYYQYIIAGTLQLAYKYKNKHRIAYNLVNRIFYPEQNARSNIRSDCIYNDTSDDESNLEIFFANQQLIPVETNIDVLLQLIAHQCKDTFGEHLINQILSHILLNFKNGVELFAVHFLGDLSVELSDENINSKSSNLSLQNIAKLFVTVPRHIVIKYQKANGISDAKQSNDYNDEMQFYFHAFYMSINNQIHSLYMRLRRLHNNSVGVKVCIYFFEQLLIQNNGWKVEAIHTEQNLQRKTSVPTYEFLKLFFSSLLQINRNSNLFEMLNELNIPMKQEIEVLGNYISSIPDTFMHSMLFIFIHLFLPLLKLYVYTKRRQAFNEELFLIIENVLNMLIQKTCICTCHTKTDYVRLSLMFLNVSSDAITVNGAFVDRSGISVTDTDNITIKDVCAFILSHMRNNNKILQNSQYFTKLNHLNGHIYIQLLSCSSDIHAEIINLMGLKDEMLWKVAGNHVINNFESSSRNASNANELIIKKEQVKCADGTVNKNELNNINLKIKKLEKKQAFIMSMLASVSDENTSNFNIANKANENSVMVNIMKYNSILLLECIILLFQKIVKVFDPTVGVANDKNSIYSVTNRNKNNNNDNENSIENIENKYHRYLMRNAINVHNKHAEENYRIMEGYESMVNIGIHLIEILLHCCNHHDVEEMRKTVRPLILILEHLYNYKYYIDQETISKVYSVRVVVLKFINVINIEEEDNMDNLKWKNDKNRKGNDVSDANFINIIKKLKQNNVDEANIAYLLSTLNLYLIGKKKTGKTLIVEVGGNANHETGGNNVISRNSKMLINVIMNIMFNADESYVYTACIYSL
jgi:hypothetical protein